MQSTPDSSKLSMKLRVTIPLRVALEVPLWDTYPRSLQGRPAVRLPFLRNLIARHVLTRLTLVSLHLGQWSLAAIG